MNKSVRAFGVERVINCHLISYPPPAILYVEKIDHREFSGGLSLFLREGVNTLTVKQQKFCDEYLICGDATTAAKKAGYSKKTAYSIGNENLNKPELKAYIQAQLAAMHDQKVADAYEVLCYLTAVMRGEYSEEVPLLVGEGVQILSDKAVGAKERLKAAELLGKRFGLFNEKVTLDGMIPVVISGGDQLED